VQVPLDIARRHPAGVQRQDLLVEAVEGAAVLGQPVSRSGPPYSPSSRSISSSGISISPISASPSGPSAGIAPTAATPRSSRPAGRTSQIHRNPRTTLARELVSIIRQLNRAISELDDELAQRTAQVAPALLELPGCAAITAAKLLAGIGPIDRFRSDAQLARHGGVAPLEASSGRTQRHRLDRGGNRQLNAALYRIAITQARYHAPAREYLERKRSEGKSRREALRCLKRLLARVVYNTLKASPALT
jgi:transposase